jgi:uncharacterized lipoprotein
MPPRSILRSAVILLASAWLVGCASPHYLQPEPRRSAEVPRSGDGQSITVVAVDEREDDVIGTRSGAAMSTAIITVEAHQLVPRLQAETERAVRDMGFSPTEETAEGRPTLTLTLERLGYARGESRPVVDEARLEAVLVAEAVNDGTTYTGTYTARRTQGFALRPSKDANTRMIEELLGDALDRAFRDPELGALLAR